MINAQRFVDSLSKLTVPKIKLLAQSCGSTSTGAKHTVLSMLHKTATQRLQGNLDAPFRIISVDLGVKNIGVCQMLAPAVASRQRPIVEKWHHASLPPNLAFAFPEFSDAAIEFADSLLAASAVEAPVDGVVFERQRSRTAGSASIPNDVLRVNIMEGMMFTALRVQHPSLLLESVPPKYVVNFWKEAESEIGAMPEPRTQAANYRLAKRVRQAVTQKWLRHSSKAPVQFASEVVEKLSTPGGKRDDINDALVQALTWVRWRENVYQLVRNVESNVDPTRNLFLQPTPEK